METIKTKWFTEGPAADKQGNIYFTTLHGGTILKLSPKGVISVWAKANCPNGQVILNNGDHLVCDSGNSTIIRFDSMGNFICHEVDSRINNIKIHRPNDLTVDNENGIYFTDSLKQNGSVFYISKNNKSKSGLVDTGINFPNGIALSRDQKKIFVAESYSNRILSARIKEPGIIDGRFETFCTLPYNPSNNIVDNLPDGVRIDDDDRLWVCHYGMQKIYIISPEGKLTESFKTPFRLPSNLLFHEGRIFVTGGDSEPGPGGVSFMNIKG